ncbi:MAG: SDR family NAD(P)-dependent oxidoreductase [Microthrixaceae bacterium]|nr:SDR family NAD(P)-dependent oxidoreductase [Microthrixaceae bacterium]
MANSGPPAGAVLVLGGRSEIGLEVARRIAPGRTVVLAARRAGDLTDEVALLERAGATEVHCVEFDADDLASHAAVFDEVIAAHGPIGLAVVAFGILGDQALAERDATHAAQILHTDFVAQVVALTELAKRMRDAGSGQLVVFSSVAGIRVRRANYVYGSAKAGLDGFANGLADALAGSGVGLLLVRPGFVIGRMTEGMDPAPLSSTPDQVADAVIQGLRRGRTRIWVPATLRPLYFVARLVPAWIWRRLPR